MVATKRLTPAQHALLQMMSDREDRDYSDRERWSQPTFELPGRVEPVARRLQAHGLVTMERKPVYRYDGSVLRVCVAWKTTQAGRDALWNSFYAHT